MRGQGKKVVLEIEVAGAALGIDDDRPGSDLLGDDPGSFESVHEQKFAQPLPLFALRKRPCGQAE